MPLGKTLNATSTGTGAARPPRLNTFQKSMLQWNDLHPYNAIHVVRVAGALDPERLKTAIALTLQRHGLTGLAMDRRAGSYQFRGGPAVAEVITHRIGSSQALAEEIEAQLNTSFLQTPCFSPFRFFAISETETFALGVVYFHAVADAESVILVVKGIVESYAGGQPAGPPARATPSPAPRDNLLRHYPGVLARKLVTFPSVIAQMRRACRPPYQDPGELSNRFAFFSLERPLLSRMLEVAKTWQVTLNDLFLALLIQAISWLTPNRTPAVRRNEIALGCIVNTRKDMDNPRAFGLFLGFFVVHHPAPPGVNLAELARDIAHQTTRIKRSRLYLGAPLELAFARRLMARLSLERRVKFYAKHYPLWGGLSNMDLNLLWSTSAQSPHTDYFRAVSTGPTTPLVLSITTIGGVANIGVTYRPSVFTASQIERVRDCFLAPPSPLACHH